MSEQFHDPIPRWLQDEVKSLGVAYNKRIDDDVAFEYGESFRSVDRAIFEQACSLIKRNPEQKRFPVVSELWAVINRLRGGDSRSRTTWQNNLIFVKCACGDEFFIRRHVLDHAPFGSFFDCPGIFYNRCTRSFSPEYIRANVQRDGLLDVATVIAKGAA